jgi:hypothetical protein
MRFLVRSFVPRERRQRRWSGGLVVAAAAVGLVGFAGTFAGTAAAGGLVTGRQIKDGSLTSVDLRTDRGVTGADVRDGSLSASKLSSLPQGPPGIPGLSGSKGVDGLDNFNYEISDPGQGQVPASGDLDILVPCPAGTRVVGGGASSGGVIRMEESRPLADGSGWNVVVFNEQTTAVDAFAWAVCVGAP